MSVLPDHLIRARLADTSLHISPCDDRAIGPASYDLTLGDTLRWWPDWIVRDPRVDQSHLWREATWHEVHDGWLLVPGTRYLAVTAETLGLPADLAGQLSARSSWGRDGLDVIQGPAGYIDPGYRGRPTLELSVTGSGLVIWPGAPCLQLVLYQCAAPAERPYGHPARTSRYQNDTVPTPARLATGVAR